MRMLAAVAGIFITLMMVSCAHREEQRLADSVNGAAPTDFGVAMTVLTGAEFPIADQAHLRESRYVLFPDGSLHYGEDLKDEHRPGWLPPLTRVLSRRQMLETWALANRLGLTNFEQAGGTLNVRLVRPPDTGIAYVAVFTGWGERWSFEHVGDASVADGAIVQFTRHLAQLAWARDEMPIEAAVAPIRYDFGDDPYARFRQPDGSPAADVLVRPKDIDSE